MGIFSFFQKKESEPAIKDLIWMSHSAKLKGTLELIQKHPDAILIAWFKNTQETFQDFLIANKILQEVRLANAVTPWTVSNKTVIFLEHYPLLNKEKRLILNWKSEEIFVLSSLDEALFKNIGSNNLVSMMQKLGMQDDEMLEHTLISKSIKRAQVSLEKKAVKEISAESAQEWFKKNKIFETDF